MGYNRARDRARARARESQTTLPCGKKTESNGRPETGKDAAVYLVGLSDPLNRG
jgi:hypothetical protein